MIIRLNIFFLSFMLDLLIGFSENENKLIIGTVTNTTLLVSAQQL